MAKKYRVNLTAEEREQLLAVVRKGTGDVRRLRRALPPVVGG
jgi:cell division protein ZapA (FtsZ GTPase activity inhibitor)